MIITRYITELNQKLSVQKVFDKSNFTFGEGKIYDFGSLMEAKI